MQPKVYKQQDCVSEGWEGKQGENVEYLLKKLQLMPLSKRKMKLQLLPSTVVYVIGNLINASK